MNILVPIAGRDRYFPEGQFVFPKPLVDICGTPLIEHTLRALLGIDGDPRFTFVVQEQDCKSYSLDDVVKVVAGPRRADIVQIIAPTQGAICSCLMAIDHIDPDEELLIANGDQVLLANLNEAINDLRRREYDAGVVTFQSTHPRFSYVRADDEGHIVETAEKRVISRLAIAGLYYFRRGSDFIEGAKRVLLNNNPVHEAFFISQALNEMILSGKTVGHHRIEADTYYPLYSPQKILEFEEALLSQRINYGLSVQRPTLVIPMAGEGARFVKAGYALPKPFIDVCGMPMISRVLDNLSHKAFDVVLLARTAHLEAEPELAQSLTKDHGFKVVKVDRLTEGSVCTILLARHEINRNAPLLIANCDQIVDFDCGKFIKDCMDRKLDGSILVFREPGRDPKWSYARIDDCGTVLEVREKVAISDLATVGIYFFAKAGYFIDAAIDMIARNDRVNNEFYTCPVYNYMIAQGQRVGVYEIAQSAMHGLGVPEDLDAYIQLCNGVPRVGNLSSR
ncbi:MAG TPA: glycosyltransferase family 2 protein [Xanthobacteraceae bacterium]|nr:glycosyltransferase family 2 protein [Xanthobacteraceae bacterium]